MNNTNPDMLGITDDLGTIVDREYHALRVLSDAENHLNQRSFSTTLDISLGMTNAIFKRLAQKGWLVMKRVNGRSLSYVVTPEGMRELARRSLRYIHGTIKLVTGWKERLHDLFEQERAAGTRKVLLIGRSDIDFMVQHIAQHYGLEFQAAAEVSAATGRELVIYCENSEQTPTAGQVHLRHLLAGIPETGLKEEST